MEMAPKTKQSDPFNVTENCGDAARVNILETIEQMAWLATLDPETGRNGQRMN